NDDALGRHSEVDIGFANRPGPSERNREPDLVVLLVQLQQCRLNRLEGALSIGLEHDAEIDGRASANLAVDLGQLDTPIGHQRFRTPLSLALFNDLPRSAFVLQNLNGVTRLGWLRQAEDLDWRAWFGAADTLAAVIEHCLDTTERGAGHD